MDELLKTELLQQVLRELKQNTANIDNKISETQDFIEKLRKGLLSWYKGNDDAEVVAHEIHKSRQDIETYKEMQSSPYFAMVDVKIEGQTGNKRLYFSKHSLPESSIFSWISPISRLRFSPPGDASYVLPTGDFKECQILRKDKYLIRQGKLFNVLYDDLQNNGVKVLDAPYSEEKVFGLTDIIEKLDVFQDDIVRLKNTPKLLISGPAGSGKTTLALHRLAYLAYSPETINDYNPAEFIIFVNDRSTLKYFSRILPQLGLTKTMITTFSDWAKEKLPNINWAKYYFESTPEVTLENYPLLAFAKNKSLAKIDSVPFSKDICTQLDYIYFEALDDISYRVYKEQKLKKMFDKLDLTALLYLKLKKAAKIETKKLILIDEAENYHPLQIQLMKKFLNPNKYSLIYIGDLVQQTSPFAIKHWSEVGEKFSEDNFIRIQKVYRFTDQIRRYLINKGYSQDTAMSLPQGQEVKEYSKCSLDEILKELSNLEQEYQGDIIGIISNELSVLEKLKDMRSSCKTPYHLGKLIFSSIMEAQGTEFDHVILVFQEQDVCNNQWPDELVTELQYVQRNQFLVGVTRARKSLKVFLKTKH